MRRLDIGVASYRAPEKLRRTLRDIEGRSATDWRTVLFKESGSGVDYAHLQQVCGAMVKLVEVVHAQGLDLHAISAGGGLSVPYRAGEPTIDTAHYFSSWDAARHAVEHAAAQPSFDLGRSAR